MAVVNSNVDVANLALAHLAVPPVSSMDERATVEQTYEPTIQALMEMYPWRFLKTVTQLARETAAPLAEWKYAYAMPPAGENRLGNPLEIRDEAGQRGNVILDFEIEKSLLLTNAEKVYLTIRERRPEGEWPAHFVMLASFALAGNWAEPITEDTDRGNRLRATAFGAPEEAGRGGLFRTSRQLDAAGGGLQQIQDFSLIEARMGGLAPLR